MLDMASDCNSVPTARNKKNEDGLSAVTARSLSKRGPAVLRKLLVQCAWAMLRYNPWARAVFDRLSRGRARRKQAVVAPARRVLVRCWAMLRDGVPWRPDPDPVPATAA